MCFKRIGKTRPDQVKSIEQIAGEQAKKKAERIAQKGSVDDACTATEESQGSKRIPMSKHWKLHECEKLPQVGVQILYSMDTINRKDTIWQLIIRREATADDLMENHNLEEEGQTIWETYLEITHCPYCGECLYGKQNIEFEDVGNFVHYDYSEWKSKRQ
jgi:hypothetical protein